MVLPQDAYRRALSSIKGRLDGHYQHEGVKWMINRELQDHSPKGGILADEMGLGKTMQTITAMLGNPLPTLIVTMVGLVGQWREALVDFGGLKPIIVNSSYQGILPQPQRGECTVIITTYSCFQRPKGQNPPCLYQYTWGRIVLDEGHVIRNKKTKLYQEISKLSADIKWILTGTPIQNGTKDLISLLTLVSVPINNNLDDLRDEFILRRTQKEEGKKNVRLQLPQLHTEVLHIEFATEIEKNIYDEVESFFQDKMETHAHDNNGIMESIVRCRQICSHPMIYFEGCQRRTKNKGQQPKRQNIDFPAISYYQEGQVTNEFESSKITFLCNDIEQNIVAKKMKCIVFCTWTLEMRLVQNALKKKSIPSLIYDGSLTRDNKETVLHNFKTSTIPVLILQIVCGSTGLNLQCASKVYIMSPHWNPCIELQAIGRAYRKGQTNNVFCVRMVMKGTIEERCIDVQCAKANVIMETMMDDSIEEILGSYKDCDLKSLFAPKEKNSVEQSTQPAIEKTMSAMLDELLDAL